MKKTMNMKKTFAAILAASMAVSAASVVENQEMIESKVDSANAKRGVEITGSIRAVAQTSKFSTDNDPTGLNHMPNVEKDEFVTADLNFGFRPWENVRANATLRLEAGMQEYFASAAKSISVAWLNAEGNVGNNLYWVVGDFRQEYSPLTLFLPGIDIMYEPQIFARKRYMAEHEQFIEGNQRNLQGANIQFRADMGDALGQIRAEALFARLNRTAVLDLSGAEGNILPNDEVWGASQSANMDKFVAAGNFEMLPLNRSLYLGVTPMYIFDNEDSYTYTYRQEENKPNSSYKQVDINPYELNPQETFIVSGRLGADVASLMGNKNVILDVTGEFAMSNDKVYTPDSVLAYKRDDNGNFVLEDAVDPVTGAPIQKFVLAQNEKKENYLELNGFNEEKQKGMALLVNANVGYKTENFGVRLAVDFVRNDSAWFNNLAQSPKFFAQRIQNSDKDGQTVKYGVNSPLYSSFDALYNFSPKFSPVALGGHNSDTDPLKPLGTDDAAFGGSVTNSYNIANYNKNSWTTNVYTRNQLALLEHLSDPALQMSLPNGLATANRMGARANLIANFKDFVEVQGLFSMFNQVKGQNFTTHVIANEMLNTISLGYKAAKFMEFGGGAKVDVFKALGFSKPLEISGSYKHSERTVDTDNWVEVGLLDQTSEIKSDFINAGLYVQYLPRLGFNAGFQMINTEYTNASNVYTALAPLMKGKQMQWMVGLDYNIASNAWLAVNFGMINVENKYNSGNMSALYNNTYNNAYNEAISKLKDPTNPTETQISNAISAAEKKAFKTVRDNMTNLPDYYDVTKDETGVYEHKFSQMVLEASLNVEF